MIYGLVMVFCDMSHAHPRAMTQSKRRDASRGVCRSHSRGMCTIAILRSVGDGNDLSRRIDGALISSRGRDEWFPAPAHMILYLIQ